MPFRNPTGVTQLKTYIYIKEVSSAYFFCLFYNYASGIVQVESEEINGQKSGLLGTEGLH